MTPLSRLLVLLTASRLVFALPGGKKSKTAPRPSPYLEEDLTPVLTLTAENPGSCSISRWYIATTIYQPTTTVSTISTNVASPYTSYIPVTYTSTLAESSIVTSTYTSTITTTAYVTTVVPSTYCYTSDIISIATRENIVYEPSTSVYTASGVYSEYVSSSASLGITWVPSLSYSNCVVTATITSSVPTSSITCAPVAPTLTLVAPEAKSSASGYKPGSGGGKSKAGGSGPYRRS